MYTSIIVTINAITVTTLGEEISADFVVLAVGHSARQLYRKLTNQKVLLIPKPIAVGFRIEHPQVS